MFARPVNVALVACGALIALPRSATADLAANSAALRTFAPDGHADQSEDEEFNNQSVLRNDPIDAVSVSLGFDYRQPVGGDFRSLYLGRLTWDLSGARHHAIGISLGAGSVHLKSGSFAEAVAHDPIILEAAAHYRYYLTHQHVFFRPYAMATLGINSLYWAYRDDVESGGSTTSWDAVLGLSAAAGLGVVFNVTQNFQVFGEAAFGGLAFGGTTSHELKNEFFDDFAYVTIHAGLGWRF
jgi:hypothetical protein